MNNSVEYELLTLGLYMGKQALHFNFSPLWQIMLVFQYILNYLEGFKPLQECSLSFWLYFFWCFHFLIGFCCIWVFLSTPPLLLPFHHVCSLEVGVLCFKVLHANSTFSRHSVTCLWFSDRILPQLWLSISACGLTV